MNDHQPYCPSLQLLSAAPLRGNPCDTHDPRICVPPLKGLPGTRATDVSYRASVPAGHDGCGLAPSYRALSPYGESLPCETNGNISVSQSPDHCSLITAHWSFTFSAKEKDTETGYSYFGARYYSSDLSIWLSVDPMAAKYPSLSPYVYCTNNPVKLVDPNGEEVIEDNPPGGIISNFLNNLENKIYGTAENRQFEGGGDGANQGTMTMQDVEVGVSVMTAMVSAGTALEAKSAIETTVAIVSAASSVDDATVNSSGQTVSQKAAANDKGASKTVTFVKTASSLASGGLSYRNVKNIVVKGRKELKKNVSKMANNVFSAASSAYSVFSTLLKKKNQKKDE